LSENVPPTEPEELGARGELEPYGAAHRYSSIARDASSKLVELADQRPVLTEFGLDDVAAECEQLVAFLDATTTFLSGVCKADASLSLKILWWDPEETTTTLHTLLRSTRTRKARERYAPRNNFSYLENSAFADILRQWPRKRSFSLDNLVEQAALGKYDNSNRWWKAFYNTTAVVPIPPLGDGKYTKCSPIGFLCADAVTGSLANDSALFTLESAAQCYYDYFAGLYEFSTGKQHLFCEWDPIMSDSVPQHLDEHLVFQHALLQLETVYCVETELPGADDVGSSRLAWDKTRWLRHSAEWMMTKPHPEQDRILSERLSTPTSRLWAKLRDKPRLSKEQQKDVLAEIATYNPSFAKFARDKK